MKGLIVAELSENERKSLDDALSTLDDPYEATLNPDGGFHSEQMEAIAKLAEKTMSCVLLVLDPKIYDAVQREGAVQHEAVQREDAVQSDLEARTPKKFFGLLVFVAIFMISKYSGFWNWVLYGQPMQEQHITVLVFGFLGIVALVLYFLPLIIARKRRHRQTLAIGSLNASLLVIVFVISFGYDGAKPRLTYSQFAPWLVLSCGLGF